MTEEHKQLFAWLEEFSKRISDEDLVNLNKFIAFMKTHISDVKKNAYMLGVEARESTKQ